MADHPLPPSVEAILDLRDEPGWFTPLCGLSMVVRTFLCLQHAGFRHITLIGPDAERAVAALQRHPYYRVQAQVAHDPPAPGDHPRVVFRVPLAFSSTTAAALAARATPDGLIVDPAQLPALPDFLLPIATPAQRRVAARAVRGTARKSLRFSGIASVTIYQPIAQQVMRVLNPLPLSPNVLTVMGFALGVASLPLLASGDRWTMAIGACMVFGVNLFDVFDGQQARIKFWFTKLGERLDVVTDEAMKLSIVPAIGLGLHAATGQVVWEIIGWAAGGGRLLYAATIQYFVWARGHTGYATNVRFWYNVGKAGGPPKKRHPLSAGRYLFRNDFMYAAIGVFGLAGFLQAPFLLCAFGAIEYGVLAFIQLAFFRHKLEFEGAHHGSV